MEVLRPCAGVQRSESRSCPAAEGEATFSGGIAWAVTFTLLGYFFGQSWQLIEKWSGRVGLFVFFVIMIMAGFVYLYRAIVRRQAELYEWFRDRYSTFISPSIRGFIERHPGVVIFIRKRLSSESYLGLHLTLGLMISALFVWILGGITEDILTGDPLVAVDRWVLGNILYFRTPGVTSFMVIASHLGGRATIIIGSLVVAAYLLFKSKFDYLITYLAAILGGNVLSLVLKMTIHRTRPLSETALMKVSGWSFPSGHAMMSVIFYGMIAYLVIRTLRSWRLRLFLAMTMGFIVFLVGFSRIYLQVHYLSDVLAGYAGGLFWLTICITGFEAYRKKERRTD